MNKKELIEGIQNLEFESDYSDYRLGFEKAKYWCLTLASNLVESEAKKVEVPSCMGEFLDHYDNKEDVSMHIVMKDFARSDYFSSFCKLNFQDYPMGWDKLMASALMYGYTVKPKRWVVKSPELYGMYFRGIAGVSMDGEFSCQWTEPKGCVKFTDKSKAEAVATLVEGSVEEV